MYTISVDISSSSVTSHNNASFLATALLLTKFSAEQILT
jgi:hypothetical protein